MVAKISKGRDFGGAVRYVMQDRKGAKLLDSEGVLLTDRKSVIDSFRLQCLLRPNEKKFVGHVSINFSVEDAGRVNEAFMVRVAQEYMRRMGICDTQYIIAAHYDRAHPHCHILFNRIRNDGRVISESNDRMRNAKVCRQLTREFHLHMAKGKDHVNRSRLRGADAVKYQIYDALVATIPQCKNWKELESALKKQGIGMDFVHRGNTANVQGVVFEKGGFRFTGSKVDRQFSYSKISKALAQNAYIGHRGLVLTYHGGDASIGGMVLSAASSATHAAMSFADSAVSGFLHSMAVPDAPSVSGGVSPSGGGSSVDLAEDEYIDGYGIRRKKHRGKRR